MGKCIKSAKAELLDLERNSLDVSFFSSKSSLRNSIMTNKTLQFKFLLNLATILKFDAPCKLSSLLTEFFTTVNRGGNIFQSRTMNR